jgi:hypothetical protein
MVELFNWEISHPSPNHHYVPSVLQKMVNTAQRETRWAALDVDHAGICRYRLAGVSLPASAK